MMKEVSSGNLGDITCVRTALCAPGRDHLASLGKTFVGGALLGFGCYPIMFIQQIFKERPEKVVAVGQFLEGGEEEEENVAVGKRMVVMVTRLVVI